MFIQGFWGCHCADIHPEHVHSLCRPDALWMCNLCEDITRVGGGTDTQFAHQILPTLKYSKLMPHYYQAESQTRPLMKLS